MKTLQFNKELSFKGEPIYLGIDVQKAMDCNHYDLF